MTIREALFNEIHYPISDGTIELKCIKRGLDPEKSFTVAIGDSWAYIGALADCLFSLITSVGFSESDKSIGAITKDQIEAILAYVNRLYVSIGENEVTMKSKPVVHINC